MQVHWGICVSEWVCVSVGESICVCVCEGIYAGVYADICRW